MLYTCLKMSVYSSALCVFAREEPEPDRACISLGSLGCYKTLDGVQLSGGFKRIIRMIYFEDKKYHPVCCFYFRFDFL